jgi:hypothetical protein
MLQLLLALLLLMFSSASACDVATAATDQHTYSLKVEYSIIVSPGAMLTLLLAACVALYTRANNRIKYYMRMLRRVRQAASDAAAQPCAHCGIASVTAVTVTAPETDDDPAAHTASLLLHTRPETAPVQQQQQQPCRPNTAAPGTRRHSGGARRTKSAGVGRLSSSHAHSSSNSSSNGQQHSVAVQAVEDSVSCTAVHTVPEVESDCEGARSARREPLAQQLELQQKELTSLLAWTEVSADLTAYLAARAKATSDTAAATGTGATAASAAASSRAARAATAGAHRKQYSKQQQQQHKRPASGYAAAPTRPHLSHAYYSSNESTAAAAAAAAPLAASAATAVRIKVRGFAARPSLSARAASAGRRSSTVGTSVGTSGYSNSRPKTSCGTPVSPGLGNGSVAQSAVTPLSVTAAQELLEVLETERLKKGNSPYGVGNTTGSSADVWEGDALLRYGYNRRL